MGLTVTYCGTEPIPEEPDEDYKLTWFSKIAIGEKFYSYSSSGDRGALEPCRKESDTSAVWLRSEDNHRHINELIEHVNPRCLVYKIILSGEKK